MKQIAISEDAYRAIALRHGDVAAFVERIALQQDAAERQAETPRSFFDALSAEGLIGCVEDAPRDLSTNPEHLEDLGR